MNISMHLILYTTYQKCRNANKYLKHILTLNILYFFSIGFVNGVTPGNIGLSFNINL